ncbi:hypothetical protein CCACVL1_27847 [Corchorus capsularis]|uniref:Protein kinase domain-containing protein n=1 Tax=Corchorus capsularis TaxID=210143 RepID=A0A1R3G8F8_COCAP|nr:hypothetical protein CCACVL1_27847 [Corchorus capsularis]
MPERIRTSRRVPSFEYELFEGDPEHLRTVVATPTQTRPWIDPASLKLKHRIGRGPFGDVWLATHHQSADDFDEYHEVAVKMLHPLKEEHMQKFVQKFEELFLKCRELQGVCWLHGVSIVNGKICIAMKFYEGSVDDKMAKSKGGKLPLPDILRYGIQLAKGIRQLHSIGLLVLNLKPSNFLLNDHDQLVLGDFGIPYLLLGIQLSDSDMALRLGTPNYMAPEQWEPDVRGPLSLETDMWGFGCSMVEMLTGVQPWFGKSIEEIYQLVVIKKEKPHIPIDLPPAVENVINGCFEYDLRNRPLVSDILHAFESSQNADNSDGGWIGLGSRPNKEKSVVSGYTTWHLAKDRLQVGDMVRSRSPLNARRPQTMDVREGTVVGLDDDADKYGFVLVKIPGMHKPLRVQESTLQRVTSGLAPGDWVRLKEENNNHSPVGVLHVVQRDGTVAVGFIGLGTLWIGKSSQLQMAKAYHMGQFVKLKANVFSPRFEWPRKRGGAWATGRISEVLPNGCLVVEFPGRFVLGNQPNKFLADPAEVESVSFDTCPGVVEKYQHVEDFHWAVRPLAIALAVFTAMKLTVSVGCCASARVKKVRRNGRDGHAGEKAGWRQRIFRDGVTTAGSTRNYCEKNDGGKQKEMGKKFKEKEVCNDIDEITEIFQRMNITKRQTSKRVSNHENEENEVTCHETIHFSGSPDTCLSFTSCSPKQRKHPCKETESELSRAKHGFWRQEQKSRAAKLQKQLKARRELESLIEEQLNRFHAQYNQANVPRHLADVAQLLMPQWAAPQELAILSWLGDWRPSAILDLLHCLAPSFPSHSTAMEQALSQLINEISVEEAVIDEEMAEIQATCVYYLPFAPGNSSRSGGSALQGMRAEFKKIAGVITKAQKLRFKTLELVVEKVLNQTDAAEFLVAFSGVQDAIHQFAEYQRLRKGPVTVTVKPQDAVETSNSKQRKIHLKDKTQDVLEPSKQPRIHLKDRNSPREKSSLIIDQERSGPGGAIQEFEEQQGLRKGPATVSVKSEDVVDTSNQPNIHIEDRTNNRRKASLNLEQEKSRLDIEDAINHIKQQEGLPKGPISTLFVKFQDLVETSKPPNST